MINEKRFFVKLFEESSAGELLLSAVIEVPGEQIAINIAQSGAMTRSGTAAFAVDSDGTGRTILLRSYGILPSKVDLFSGLFLSA